MAPYILADEKDLVFLPEPLTYADGAQVACGFGTVYEALEKIGCSGNDAVLVVGLGPVGLAALMLAKAMGANLLLGVDVNPERIELAKKLGLVDDAFAPDGALEKVRARTGGHGVEKALDASASEPGRALAIRPDRLITHRFALEDAGEAYALMASGHCGKVAVVFDGTEDKKHV